MKFGEIRKPLLVMCLSASIALHCGAIWVFYSRPLILDRDETKILMRSSPSPILITKDNAELLVEKMEKALEESLNQTIAVAHFSKPNAPIAQETPIQQEEESGPLAHSPIAKLEAREEDLPAIDPTREAAASLPPLFDPEKEATLSDFVLDNLLAETPKEDLVMNMIQSEANLSDPLPVAQAAEDDYSMTFTQFAPDALPYIPVEGVTLFIHTLNVDSSNPSISEEKFFSPLPENSASQLILPNSVEYLRSQWVKRSMFEITLPDLDYYGLDQVSENLKWQEDLNVDVVFMPDPSSNRYVFSLTIHPEFEENYESMKQNFYFIIDHSSSIEKHKTRRYKMAVQRSLAALCQGDQFNIYFFDKYVTKLSEKNLAVTPHTILMAENFLEQGPNKQIGARQPFRSLENVLPAYFDPNELHSIILITNGNSLQSAFKQKKLIQYLAGRNQRNINFYTAASGKGNNLLLLDLLSYATAGKLLYSDTNAGFPRKMVHLVKNLHDPIIKDLTIEISPSAANANVQLFPNSQYLPPIFAGQPYVITGTVDELCDLTLYIQGKSQDTYLNARKRLSLTEATSGGRALEKSWADAKAKFCYELFLQNGKLVHLKQAEQIVAPFHGDIAIPQ